MEFDVISPEKIAAFAEENGRVALTFVPEIPNETVRSFVGGYPRLPFDMDWPKDDQTELMFLLQVDLADLPWRPDGWPSGGTLFFFHNPRLEDADHSKTAISRAENGAEYPSRFVYFACEGTKLVARKPSQPYARKTFFQYAGDGKYAYRKPVGPRVERDCLPHAAIRFAPYVQYYPGAWFNSQLEESGMEFPEAWETYGEAFSHLQKILTQQQERDKEQSMTKLGALWNVSENQEQLDRRIYGGAPLIDVDGLLQKLPPDRAFKRIRQQTGLDPRYASWPETGGMVMYHAASVESQVKLAGGQRPRHSLVERCVDQAREWADWGQKRAFQVLTDEERDEYLAWARLMFRETLTVYERSWRARPIRRFFVPPFGKAKGISSKAAQARQIAEALLLLSDAREFGLRILDPDQISAMPQHAQLAYLQ
ncbi:MAG: DUF1963 domain-containing protein, partial [Pseudomonadota bacterium]